VTQKTFWRFALPALVLLAGIVVLVRHAVYSRVDEGISWSSSVFDRSGELLYLSLNDRDSYRMHARLADFPPRLIEAVLIQEDRRFRSHIGFDAGALFRSAWTTWVRRERRMGASTITMQLARLKGGIHTKTVPGKIRQVASALWLEFCYSKEERFWRPISILPRWAEISRAMQRQAGIILGQAPVTLLFHKY
jgi:penicillin-binding protein 1C